ncbi:nicotinamide N-methyltransferase-like isoform X2 [Mizuhopecten yessoensis]|nr:nicotinamide N-methyltransferase-like isoform X2 [Mizuhopecten yessoensis]
MEQLKEASDLKNFDPEWYMQNVIASDEAAYNMRFDFDVLHKFFNEYDVCGKRLLDVGTGPTIHTVISASSHVDEIFLSDYTPQNLHYLEKWHKGEISQPANVIEYVLSLEGGTRTASEVESEIRKKVQGILPIDVTSAQPLGNFNGDTQFDIIVSSYCIGTAAFTVEEYRKCLENISSLLKKGGYLILFVCLNGDSYQMGDYRYRALSITKEEIQSTLYKAGFDIKVSFEIKETDYDAIHHSFDSYYYMLATK